MGASARSISLLVLGLLVLSSILIHSADRSNGEEEISPLGQDNYYHQRIYLENDLVYRAAVGDLIADREGNEIATCSRNGKVVVSHGTRWSWESEVVHRSRITGLNEIAQVYSMDAGDLLPEEEGDEFIAGDEDNAVNLISYNENSGEWRSEVIWKDNDWIYEVDIGELIGSSDQPEIVAVGPEKRATMLSREGVLWRATTIATDIDVFDACWIGDIFPGKEGNEVIMGGGRGVVVAAYLENGSWVTEDLFNVGSQITDILTTDLDPTTEGNEIYATTLGGDLFQIYQEEGNWTGTSIHSNNRKVIYGLETGIFNGERILSIATWTNHVGIFWYKEGINFKKVYQEEFYLMGTGVFDVDPAYEGNEILGLSYLGRVTAIHQEDLGAEIILPFRSITLGRNESVKVPFIVKGMGGYDGQVEIEVPNDLHLQPSVSDPSVDTNSIHYLNLSVNVGNAPIHEISLLPLPIIARTTHGSISTYLKVSISDEIVASDFADPVIDSVVSADGQEPISLEFQKEGLTTLTTSIDTYLRPNGIDLIDMDEIINIDISGKIVNGFLSSVSWVQPGTYLFFITADMQEMTKRAVGIVLTVTERTVPNFNMALVTPFINLPKGGNITVNLNLISEFGFNKSVSLLIMEEIPGMTVNLSSEEVVPPAQVKIGITVDNVDEREVTFAIRGRSGGKTRDVYLTISIQPQRKNILTEYDHSGYMFEEKSDNRIEARFTVLLTPEHGSIEDLNIRIIGLPDNYSISITPNSIPRLYYPLNVTFVIEGPSEEVIDKVSINLSNIEDGAWEFEIVLIEPEDTDGNGNIPGWTILVIILLFIVVGGILMFLYSKRTGELKPNEGDKGGDEVDRTLPRRSASPERFDRRGGGRGRFGDHP